jgi:hypothetical protein
MTVLCYYVVCWAAPGQLWTCSSPMSDWDDATREFYNHPNDLTNLTVLFNARTAEEAATIKAEREQTIAE